MKIVILDSETVSRNDVSLEGITVLGESIVYGFTPNEQVAECSRHQEKASRIAVCVF